jgi:hypothetical protein
VSTVGSVRGDLLGLHLSNFVKVKRGSSNFIHHLSTAEPLFHYKVSNLWNRPWRCRNLVQTLTPLHDVLCPSCKICVQFLFFFNVTYICCTNMLCYWTKELLESRTSFHTIVPA